MHTLKVSVIVPMYNVEKYIKQCATSLFDQTYDNMEYIFVDDCSTDQTLAILKKTIDDYPARKGQIKILHNEINKGVAATRNIGLTASTGNYIAWCDSDDWFDISTFAELCEISMKNGADVVIFDYYEEKANNASLYINTLPPKTNKDFLMPFLKKSLTSLCTMFVNKKLYDNNDIKFINGCDYCEDLNAGGKILYCANDKIIYINNAYYHYRNNPNSITHCESKSQNISGLKNTIELLNYYIERGASKRIIRLMAYRILMRKRFYLYNEKDIRSYCTTQSWTNKYIISNHMCGYGLKSKFVEISICLLYLLQMYILKLKIKS